MPVKIQDLATVENNNRKLADELELLRIRGQHHPLGDYYIVNVYGDGIHIHHLGSGANSLTAAENGFDARQMIADFLDRITVRGSRVTRDSVRKPS